MKKGTPKVLRGACQTVSKECGTYGRGYRLAFVRIHFIHLNTNVYILTNRPHQYMNSHPTWGAFLRMIDRHLYNKGTPKQRPDFLPTLFSYPPSHSVPCWWQLVGGSLWVEVCWWQMVDGNWLVAVSWWQWVGGNWWVATLECQVLRLPRKSERHSGVRHTSTRAHIRPLEQTLKKSTLAWGSYLFCLAVLRLVVLRFNFLSCVSKLQSRTLNPLVLRSQWGKAVPAPPRSAFRLALLPALPLADALCIALRTSRPPFSPCARLNVMPTLAFISGRAWLRFLWEALSLAMASVSWVHLSHILSLADRPLSGVGGTRALALSIVFVMFC